MNTKAIIGLILVVIIIALVVIWLRKTPPSPAQPIAPVVPAETQTPVSATVAPAAPTAPSSAEATAGKGGIISTSMVGDMKIEVTKEGTGPAITNGQTAEMLYTGTLADGTVFDSTASRGNTPFSFTLGVGQVIKGWDQGVVGMKVGEERTLIIPADMAYGAAGYPPVIPQNATLTFQVTLVGIK